MYDRERSSRHYYEGRARWYDWTNRFAAFVRGVSGEHERRRVVDRLGLQTSQRILEVSVGTGTNLPFIAEHVGSPGRIVGLDISRAMLERCRRKLQRHAVDAILVEGEAAHLPFANGAFDAVFHHGGLAEFGGKRGAIAEMVRAARSGGRVVICDVGVPTDRELPLRFRLLLKLQPEYEQPPPMELLPADVRDVHLSWVQGGSWYVIEFEKP